MTTACLHAFLPACLRARTEAASLRTPHVRKPDESLPEGPSTQSTMPIMAIGTFYHHMGVSRRGELSRPAPRVLCYIPLVMATCYIPPVADLRFSNKPWSEVAKLRTFCRHPHEANLYPCQSCWLAKAILMQNIGGGM